MHCSTGDTNADRFKQYINKGINTGHNNGSYSMRVSDVFEQQLPYRWFLSWDTDALRKPAQNIAATVSLH